MQIRQHGDRSKPAVIVHPHGTVVTFGELEARANQLAHYFRRVGLTPGDTIAVLMENNAHMHAIMWAARRAGLYYTLINTHLNAAEAAYIIDNSAARMVIGSQALRDVCSQLAEHLPAGLPDSLLVADGELDGWQSYPECVCDELVSPIDDETEGELLQYSSGTTGRPKGIRRELTNLSPDDAPNLLNPLLTALDITADAVYLSPAPLYHTAPSMWSMCVQALGATVVVMERFDPAEALKCIERYRVTHGQFVPTMFVRMLKLPVQERHRYDLSSLHRVVHAAAPCPPQVKRDMIEWWGPIVDEFYSSSEGSGVTFIDAEDWLAHPGSVGRALVGTPHIVGPDGGDLGPSQIGDVYFDGAYSFSYLNDAAKTAASRHMCGWTTVGDMGYLDDDGYLYLTDRRHNMIISGGVNIYPQEAENTLVGHPKVLDAAVFGVPDDAMGQSVKAVVQTVDPRDATPEFAEELLSWLRDRLAHYKCPRSISFEGQLPRTDAGKLYKQQLIEKYGQIQDN